MMSAEQVTARYRAAKKHHADKAIRVGGLRSEIATLASRTSQQERGGQDTGALVIVATRTQDRLDAAITELDAAANDYRVAHMEMLMTAGPQRHYIDSISKQRLLAHISQDENEAAILHAMQVTLALILSLVAQRTAAAAWKHQVTTDPDIRQAHDELETSAAGATIGIFRTTRGTVHEVDHLGGGVLRAANVTLGCLPYDYVPGMPFADGHLMLSDGVHLAKQVDQASPTGYSAAYSVVV